MQRFLLRPSQREIAALRQRLQKLFAEGVEAGVGRRQARSRPDEVEAEAIELQKSMSKLVKRGRNPGSQGERGSASPFAWSFCSVGGGAAGGGGGGCGGSAWGRGCCWHV